MKQSLLDIRETGLLYPMEAEKGSVDPGYSGVFVRKLSVELGRITAIVGKSGSGKSTLLSMIAGLKQPNATRERGSSVLLLNCGIGQKAKAVNLLENELPDPGGIGFVFQEPLLLKGLSAKANYDAGRMVCPETNQISFTEFATNSELLSSFYDVRVGGDMSSEMRADMISNLSVRTFSGGQAQRISVGRALVIDPEILICDEPTSNLDPVTARTIMGLIRRWVNDSSQNRSVIWVTHDIELASEFADEYIVTSRGHVCTDGGGRPFTINRSNFSKALKSINKSIEAFKEQESWTKAKFDELDVKISDTETGLVSFVRELFRQIGSWRPAPFSPLVFGFLARCVFAEMFGGNQRLGNLRNAIWNRINGFTKWGMALSFLLGFFSLYLSFAGYWASKEYFDKALSAPEISHFLVKTDGASREIEEQKFSPKGAIALRDSLRTQFKNPKDLSIREPGVFGRYMFEISPIQIAVDGVCEPLHRSQWNNLINSAVTTASEKEPLFKEHFRQASEHLTSIKSASAYPAIVSQVFYETLIKESGEPEPSGFCLPRFGDNAYFAIGKIVPKIPGSGVRTYEVLVGNDAYFDFYDLIEDRTLNRYEPFKSLALYFDASYARDMICGFFDKKEANDNQCGDIKRKQGFVTNSDVLEQQNKLLDLANLARTVIQLAIILYALLVATSLGLTLNAFIWENQKFLSVLKAFRYRFVHLFFLGFFQTSIILFLSSVVAFGFATGAAAIFALFPIFDHEFAELLKFDISIFILSFVSLWTLSTIVVMFIIGCWWVRNRFVGNTLQSM